MTDLERNDNISREIDKHGPLFVRALCDSQAMEDVSRNDYFFWHIGHTDNSQLEQDVIDQHIYKFGESLEEGLDGLAGYLELVGYVVLSSCSAEPGYLVAGEEENKS